MEVNISDQLQHLQLAQVAPPSHSDGSSPSAAEEARTPTLPPELVEDIIQITVKILVEEERHLPSQVSVTNNFLLKASVVNGTWRPIARVELLKNGLITPTGVNGFFEEVKECNMERTLDRVRFGAGKRKFAKVKDRHQRVGEEEDKYEEDGRDLWGLFVLLPRLAEVELVGIGLRLRDLVGLPLPRLRHLIISNTTPSNLRMCMDVFASHPRSPPPTRLSIIEARGRGGPHRMRIPSNDYLFHIPELCIYSKKATSIDYPAVLLQAGGQHADEHGHPLNLRSFSLEYTQANVWPMAEQFYAQEKVSDTDFPDLHSLSMYLGPIHFFATKGNRPALASLHVLGGDPDEAFYTRGESERRLLEIVRTLPVLQSLKVPAIWQSASVQRECKAKGIDLKWT